MKKKAVWAAALLIAALLLGGCGAPQKDESDGGTTEPAPESTPLVPGALAERVEALLAPYGNEVALVSEKYPESLACFIPGDLLRQMAQDAWDAGAEETEGKWRFVWRQYGRYVYESTAEEAMALLAPEENDPLLTPDPADETPMDSQLNGDYAVSGGGLFERARAYDAEGDLSRGSAECTDTLNGQETGREVFRFCVRQGALVFADAVMEMDTTLDGLAIRPGYWATVGMLRSDGLEIVEYRLEDLDALPDPDTLDWDRFLASVTPQARLSAQRDTVRLTRP